MIQSKRDDKRGHWPSGKRRNQDIGDWSKIRKGLVKLLSSSLRPGVISSRALAKDIGVDERAIRKWLSGECRPLPASQEACRVWLGEKRKLLKSEAKKANHP